MCWGATQSQVQSVSRKRSISPCTDGLQSTRQCAKCREFRVTTKGAFGAPRSGKNFQREKQQNRKVWGPREQEGGPCSGAVNAFSVLKPLPASSSQLSKPLQDSKGLLSHPPEGDPCALWGFLSQKETWPRALSLHTRKSKLREGADLFKFTNLLKFTKLLQFAAKL